MRWPRFTLHQQISHKQNTNTGLELHITQIQIILEPGKSSGSLDRSVSIPVSQLDQSATETYNVVSIQVVEDVHDDGDREQSKVNLANESFLGFFTLFRSQTGNVGRSFFPRVRLVGIGQGVGDDLDIVDMGLADAIIVVGVPRRHASSSVVTIASLFD